MNVWPIIRALTLHRPWDLYMAHGLKPIENRDWMPPEWMLDQLLALHSGQHYDVQGAAWIRESFPHLEHAKLSGPVGAVVSVVRLVAVIEVTTGGRKVLRGKLPIWFSDEDMGWYIGRYGWVVEAPDGGRAKPLPKPVAARGFQKLWTLPAAAEAEVLAQVRAPQPAPIGFRAG